MSNNILSQIIELIQNNGGRYIIAEEGKPEYVVMSMKEYKKLVAEAKRKKNYSEEELERKINKEIALWREEEGGFSDEGNVPQKEVDEGEKDRFDFYFR